MLHVLLFPLFSGVSIFTTDDIIQRIEPFFPNKILIYLYFMKKRTLHFRAYATCNWISQILCLFLNRSRPSLSEFSGSAPGGVMWVAPVHWTKWRQIYSVELFYYRSKLKTVNFMILINFESVIHIRKPHGKQKYAKMKTCVRELVIFWLIMHSSCLLSAAISL